MTQDRPESREEEQVFSISKQNRDSKLAGSQIRPQQVQVKLGMLDNRILESSFIGFSFVTEKVIVCVCTFTFVRLVHCLAL